VFEPNHAAYYPEVRAVVEKVPGVQLLNTAHYFCEDRVCSMNQGDALVFRDDNHLDNNGSRFLANRMLIAFPQFRAALGLGQR
jgi:hypothetical protein